MRDSGRVAVVGLGFLVASATGAASAANESSGEFAPPVRLRIGDPFLGAGRLYPSPVLHDLDEDGRSELLIGDLIGNVTVAQLMKAEGGAVTVASEKPLLGRDGKPIRFHNW